MPIPRPKAGDPDKQVDEAAESLAGIMEERRQQPLYTAPDGMASHPMASVRLLQRRASLTAVEGGPRVFIVGEADRLVPQESSPEAANALLKLLEEPPAGSLFVLTATELHIAVPALLAELQRRGAALKDLSTHHATLEDVFVSLTGRTLRDV